MKRFWFLALILLLGVGCTQPKNRDVDDDLFGNLNREDQVGEGEIVFEEPDPVDGGGSTLLEEPEVCDTVSIVPYSLEEVQAGEEVNVLINATGACDRFLCTLISGPEWLRMDGCSLRGLPDTHESLGEHALQIKVEDREDANNADVRDFTLMVFDEPRIVPYLASECDNAKKAALSSDADNGEHAITWRREKLCLKIEGHAAGYTVSLDEIRPAGGFSEYELGIEPADDSGHRFEMVLLKNGKPVNPNEPVLDDTNEDTNEFIAFDAVTVSAGCDFCHPDSQTFSFIINENKCDTPMTVTRISKQILNNNGTERSIQGIDSDDDKVLLGSKHAFVYEVQGGEGSYEWSFINPSRVEGDFNGTQNGNGEPDCLGLLESIPRSSLEGACGDNMVKQNTNWHEPAEGEPNPVPNDPEGDGSRYYPLVTEFDYDEDKDLPYDLTYQNTIYDRVKITVTSPACKADGGASEKTFTDSLKLTLPIESVSDIQVKQVFDRNLREDFSDGGSESGNIQDHNAVSRMGIVLEDRRQNAMAVVEYKLHDCNQDMKNCTDPKNATPATTLQTDSVDEIGKLFLTFVDWSFNDSWCSWDCDDDQLDYLLGSIRFTTKYRTAKWRDTDNRIGWQVTPDPGGGWIGIGDNLPPVRDEDTYNCLAQGRGTVTAGGSEMCVAEWGSANERQYYFVSIADATHLYGKTYSFGFPTWLPLLRPDYSE